MLDSKTDAIRCQILGQKCNKFDFRWGSTPDPAGGAYLQRSPESLAVFKWPTSNGKEEEETAESGTREEGGDGEKEGGGKERS